MSIINTESEGVFKKLLVLYKRTSVDHIYDYKRNDNLKPVPLISIYLLSITLRKVLMRETGRSI